MIRLLTEYLKRSDAEPRPVKQTIHNHSTKENALCHP
jgi:hypothetical protein